MDSNLFSRRRAERFAQLLDEANGGRRHHVRSRADDQLAALVAVGQRLPVARPAVEVDPEFRTGLRAMLLATAEREGIGAPATVTTEPASRRSAAEPGRNRLLPAVTARRARARGAILVGVAAGAVALSGISAASENAVPGDALYGMKRSTERAQLALASSDVSRGQLFLDFARTRLAEAATLRGDEDGFSAVLNDMDADTRQGVRLLTGAAVQRSDPAALDAVNSFLTGQRRAVGGLLDDATRADRDRTRRSLALLDAARKRSDALRAAIACGLPAPVGSDALGPVPATCPGDR
ncbi:DUF5667 domain-containing protein [Micromonospora peucetia]|uniref:DUF5667 domain-containing protein n=1 Tax=Micromonospora peucetia TaxID=47871 RepID=A0A1C6V7N8_9ACTN|nr:DUF5667 domain-containing protein [Micromonospora peucetia]MCX4389301.1 DUF5667 domain-containing protein [Micromonospora peucetia]WSA35484.1 DUF5667 domain-containing protein [Micromonospora peucetia]SCL62094.1 hypothetical protein GA0070608_2582 [Micromonospora peucetia]